MQIPRFSSARYLQLSDEVLLPAKTKAKTEWIISRKLCLYKRFGFEKVPKNKRQAALELEINRWSPFSHAQFHVIWSGHFAQVWSWDEERVLAMVTVAQVNPQQFFPETVLRLQPRESGFQIITCLEGFELQLWENNSLKSSRWIENLPSDVNQAQWKNIARSYCLVNSSIPEPIASSLNPLPWGGLQFNLGYWGEIAEQNLLVVMATVFLSYVIWQGTTILYDNNALTDIRNRLAQEITQAEPILDARLQAIDHKLKIEALADMLAHHNQLALVEKVARQLKKDHTLVEWKYTPEQLRFFINAPGSTPLEYIRKYQKLKGFQEVTAEPSRKKDEIEVAIKLMAGA